MLVSYAIGAMLGAVFLEILPHAFEKAASVESISATLLVGLLLFFVLEKLVIWRHCHGDHCEVHAIHTGANCPDASHHSKAEDGVKFKPVTSHAPSIVQSHTHAHSHHDHGRSGMMIMIGDTFHNFVDGVLIAAAFLQSTELGIVTALAIIAHEIPQEVGDYLILLHSGYSKVRALVFNLLSSLATLVGAMLAYFALSQLTEWIPTLLGLGAASMIYVAVADLIPGLHKRTDLRATIQQVLLIGLGVGSIALVRALAGE